MNVAYRLFPKLYTRASLTAKAIAPTRRAALNTYFQNNSIHRLQIGAGRSLYGGWCHGDIDCWNRVLSREKEKTTVQVFMDLLKPLPFAENTFDVVYSSHVHEHFPYRTGEAILTECFRVLKPGAPVRIVVPRLEFYIEKYLQKQAGE
jgi:predicted SAM-dependent methyltransferase